MKVLDVEGPVTAVALVGRLDAAGADAVSLRFTAAVASAARHAVVDLSGVSFIASMGMRLLVSAARALHQKGFKLVVYGAGENVAAALADAALDQIIPLAAHRDDALARVAA